MNDIVIRVEHLGKRYRIGQREQYQALRDVFTEAMSAPFRRLRRADAGTKLGSPQATDHIWALRDVSFEVRNGEVIGIIGRNGTGKSTLLKILSRITKPTTGYAVLHGRVGSLLEVGSGFHPELTGRENTFLNGAILGMRKAEIARKFDEIVSFAELEQFIDTPVKRYSSGMYMRLAFAVAAHLEPEILVVDEVLAVGDAAFQQKCLGKMGDVARQGRTVLFVSHNLLAVESLCGRAIWLHNGQIAGEGRPGQVISSYLQTALSTSTEHVWPISKDLETPSVQLRRVRVRPLDDASESITVHTPFMLEFEYWNSDPGAYIFISFCLYDEHDILLFDLCPPWEPEWRQKASPLGMLRSVCHIPGDLLNNGRHRVAVTVWCNNVASVEEPDALAFTIHDTTEDRHGWYGEWKGAIRPMLQWETNLPLEAPIAPLDLEFEMPHVGGEA